MPWVTMGRPLALPDLSFPISPEQICLIILTVALAIQWVGKSAWRVACVCMNMCMCVCLYTVNTVQVVKGCFSTLCCYCGCVRGLTGARCKFYYFLEIAIKRIWKTLVHMASQGLPDSEVGDV